MQQRNEKNEKALRINEVIFVVSFFHIHKIARGKQL